MEITAKSLSGIGCATVQLGLDEGFLAELRETLFANGVAGKRCLLDLPLARTAAVRIRQRLVESEILPPEAIAIQAIAFDKTPLTNWKVSWHQDVMFPFQCPPPSAGYELHSIKDGVDYARPPVEVLENLLAVRLHLDDCGISNGPLRVAPGSHDLGIIRSADIAPYIACLGEITCLARNGEAVLMKPLALHASSPAMLPHRRRVLHFVYHTGGPIDAVWYRSV